MNVTVVRNAANNQISVFTGTGLQLVCRPQASQLSFNNAGTLSATVAVERRRRARTAPARSR